MDFPTERENLISFLENCIVDYDDWKLEESDEKIKKYGEFIALLKANVPFVVVSDEEFSSTYMHDDEIFKNGFWIIFPDIENDATGKLGNSYLFSINEKEEFNKIG
jgi:hypothetical protein